MFRGKLLAIVTRPGKKTSVQEHHEAEVAAGQGLKGDHACADGTKGTRQVTLIESEALALAAVDYQLDLTHAESRRNLLTQDVPLNQLVGREFQVGETVLRGLELCEPCKYLEGCLQRELVDPLRHRGGLRAEVVSSGWLRVGDSIEPLMKSDSQTS